MTRSWVARERRQYPLETTEPHFQLNTAPNIHRPENFQRENWTTMSPEYTCKLFSIFVLWVRKYRELKCSALLTRKLTHGFNCLLSGATQLRVTRASRSSIRSFNYIENKQKLNKYYAYSDSKFITFSPSSVLLIEYK